MPTKAELLKQAKKEGVTVSSSATKAEIEAALAGSTDTAATDAGSTGGPRSTARLAQGEQQVTGDEGKGPEPHEVNDMLASDRMQALLDDHRKMGSRPG
jgi:hypothetical protein